MATLVATPRDLAAVFQYPESGSGDWDAWAERSQDKIAELQKVSDKLPAGEIKGALLQWQVADGYAYYLVTSAQPLKLCHLPFLDGYAVSPVLIRGLRRSDVEEQLRRARAINELFGRNRHNKETA